MADFAYTTTTALTQAASSPLPDRLGYREAMTPSLPGPDTLINSGGTFLRRRFLHAVYPS
jgi:hypothetical protein